MASIVPNEPGPPRSLAPSIYGSWRQLASGVEAPPACCDHTMVAFEGRLITFGGNLVWGESATSALHVWDSHTHVWHMLQAMGEIPEARCAHTAHVINRRMYVLGGCEGDRARFFGDVYYLDLDTFRWFKVAATFTPRGYHASCVVGDNVYILGGYDGVRLVQTVEVLNLTTLKVKHLNLEGDLLPTYLFDHTANVVGDDIYVTGGASIRTDVLDQMSFCVIDTVSGICKRLPSQQEPRSVHVTERIGDYLVSFGGRVIQQFYRALNTLSAYHIGSGLTAEVKFRSDSHVPPRVAGHASAVIGRDLYIQGGYDGSRTVDPFFVLRVGVESLRAICETKLGAAIGCQQSIPSLATMPHDVADAVCRQMIERNLLQLAVLSTFPTHNLQHVSFGASSPYRTITNEWIEVLCRTQPHLQTLDVTDCMSLNDEIGAVLSQLSHLTVLVVRGCWRLTGTFLLFDGYPVLQLCDASNLFLTADVSVVPAKVMRLTEAPADSESDTSGSDYDSEAS